MTDTEKEAKEEACVSESETGLRHAVHFASCVDRNLIICPNYALTQKELWLFIKHLRTANCSLHKLSHLNLETTLRKRYYILSPVYRRERA